MAEFQYKLDGVDKVIDELSKLSKKLQRKTAVNAARRAMVPIRDAAKANARKLDDPKTKNKIYRNIAIQQRSRMGRRIGGVVMSVGVRGCGRKGGTGAGWDTFYWRFLEFGTARTRAKPFLRPAFGESQQQQAIDNLSDEFWRGINESTN